MRLDEVVTGRADFRAVIDGIAAVALELINALLRRSSGTVDLTLSTPALRAGRRRRGRQAGSPTTLKDYKPVRGRRGTKAGRASTRKRAAPAIRGSKKQEPSPKAPTPKMVAYAESLARGKNVTLPEGYERDFKACRRFLDEHAQ
jgi:DNA topoisomerase III